METPFELWKAAQLKTCNQLQGYRAPLMQSRQVPTPARHVPTPIRHVPIHVRPVPTHVSKDLDKGTAKFQQMLLTDSLPWIPEQLKPQAANFQGPRNHLPRRPLGLNPEATEFHVTQINRQLSKGATSQAPQIEVSASIGTISAVAERIKMLENEVAALKMALKIHTESCTCKKEECQLEYELQTPKQFSDYSSLGDSRQLEVDDGSSSNLIEL